MRVLLTGATGFLGWHTRVRLRALTDHVVVPVSRAQWQDLPVLAQGVDAILHVAGINRAPDEEVERGNVELARAVARAALTGGSAPRLVFANSIQSDGDSPYGAGKGEASRVLAAAAADLGSPYVDVRLPNLFGEHGRPRYNSFVATFVDAVIGGRTPQVTDRPVALLHAQGAAQALLDALTSTASRVDPPGHPTSVQEVLSSLGDLDVLYSSGDIPPLLTALDRDLFNTLRAARFAQDGPIPLSPRVDDRGRLVETVRAHGGQGQTFVSTTRPGVTRGEHFHLHKIERFVVLAGRARIRLRRLFTDDVVSFDVTGDAPVAIDMPTMWAHDITNTGSTELTTLFWTNELFDPAAPDTYPEKVAIASGAGPR